MEREQEGAGTRARGSESESERKREGAVARGSETHIDTNVFNKHKAHRQAADFKN
jgi:hypothetical protein